MANINEILARAESLRKETALNSIDPERAGGIMYDTLLALNELWLQQGAALVISKIYASVAAMEADTAPVSDLSGKLLRPGQIVVIASSDSDNGSVYRYNGTESPSWTLVGTIGNLEPVDSLDSDSTALPLAAHQGKVLDGKISQLGQRVINRKTLFLEDSDFTNVLTGVVDYYATDAIDLTKEYYLKVCGYRENNKAQTIIQVYDGNNTLVEQVGWDARANKVYEIKCAGFVFLIDSQFLPQNATGAFMGYNLHLNKFPRKEESIENAVRLNELLDKSAYAADGADYSGTWSHGLLQSDGTEDTSRTFGQLYVSDFYKCTSTKDFAFVRLNGLNTLASDTNIAKQQPPIVNICLYDQNKNFVKCYNASGSAIIGVPKGYYLRTWHDSTACAIEDFIKTDVTLYPTEKILDVVESNKSAVDEKFSIIIPFFENNKEILKDVLNYFVGNDGNLVHWNALKYAIFDVSGLSKIDVHVSNNGYYGAPIWSTFSQLVDGDVAAAYLVRNHIATSAEQYQPYDETIQLQDNENYIAINYSTQSTCGVSYLAQPDTSLAQLEDRIEDIEEEIGGGKNKLMKVVIGNNGAFRIRTKYNAQKDIIITHHINGNSCLSFQYAYIGAKSLSDEELMVSNNRVSNNADSTAPLYNVPEYWFIFGNHGYLIPTISNSVGMTSSDVGAIWKDQDNNRYTIGKVTDTTIYLLPYIYQDAQGHYHREWNGTLTTLTHVSGGVYTNTISVVGYNTTQTYPLMNSQNRKFFADGIEVSAGDIVYCDNFTAQEEQLGYDPATINWFGGTGGETDLTNAEIMVKLLFSFNYHGAMCCLNTTFDLRRDVLFGAYGALQQEFPSDNGNYQAMVMIPKVAIHDGIEIDKPFHSVSESSTIDIYRTAQHLKDVDDLPDRMICYLQNPNNNEYLVGMAAGFSLVSGDTINSKRLQNMPQGDTNFNYIVTRLGRNYVNKFYNFAFNSAPYTTDGYYIPTTFFKQVNCYVCYFDPAENVGQVYWYKDGNRYLIYAHCQQVENKLSISLPEEMNGLSLSVVEKTNDAELLTDVIQNGEILVNFNSADANYIVLCTK